jgi:hypothetical protein
MPGGRFEPSPAPVPLWWLGATGRRGVKVWCDAARIRPGQFFLPRSMPCTRAHLLLGRVGWLSHRRSNGAAHPCAGEVCRVTAGRPRLNM